MNDYETVVYSELRAWQEEMVRKPTLINRLSKKLQRKVNSWLPEKFHRAVTATVKEMVRGVLFGAKYTTASPGSFETLEALENAVSKKIEFYRNTAAIEGGITGAGGILLGLADFPILLALKLKLLFDIASLYGYDVKDYKERVFILHIFELAFSSHEHRKNVYRKIEHWDQAAASLPDDIKLFDWRNFQQEYRDYIDIAKIGQLLPVIGAPVGVIANYGLIKKLGRTAMNAYRSRLPNNAKQLLSGRWSRL